MHGECLCLGMVHTLYDVFGIFRLYRILVTQEWFSEFSDEYDNKAFLFLDFIETTDFVSSLLHLALCYSLVNVTFIRAGPNKVFKVALGIIYTDGKVALITLSCFLVLARPTKYLKFSLSITYVHDATAPTFQTFCVYVMYSYRICQVISVFQWTEASVPSAGT